jgi:PLAT/LH2 domain
MTSLSNTNPLYNYQVTVKTGNLDDSGTDANVTIKIIGSKGSTEFLPLDDERNNFEKGDIDTFQVQSSTNVGDITGFTLKQDGSGKKPGWYVEYVAINGVSFTVNQWLGDNSSGEVTVTK